MEDSTVETQQTIDIDSYCYYQADGQKKTNDSKVILCQIVNFLSNEECLIIDLIQMKRYTVSIHSLSLISDKSHLEKATKLNNVYQKKWSSQKNSKNSIFVTVFLCLLLSGMSVVCFWRASIYFDAINQYRRERTSLCKIVNYTLNPCQYNCNINENRICNGTIYQLYAISNISCGANQLLSEINEYSDCPQSMINVTDIGNIETCFILDCDEGFYFYPPHELLEIDDPMPVIWTTIAYFIGVCGICCGLYAFGEYIASLG